MAGAAILLSAIGGAPLVAIENRSVLNLLVPSPGPAQARYELESDGEILVIDNIGTYSPGNWITPPSAASGSYEVRATLNSGDTPDGSTLNTWHALSADRHWELTQSGVGEKECELTVEIRFGTTVLSTALITLHVEVI